MRLEVLRPNDVGVRCAIYGCGNEVCVDEPLNGGGNRSAEFSVRADRGVPDRVRERTLYVASFVDAALMPST